MLAHLLLEEDRRGLIHGVEIVFLLLRARLCVALRCGGARLFYLVPRASGERAHRFGERVAVVLHQEVDDRARLLATEAVKKTAIGVHVKAAGLLLMKRAEADERTPATLERWDALAHD